MRNPTQSANFATVAMLHFSKTVGLSWFRVYAALGENWWRIYIIDKVYVILYIGGMTDEKSIYWVGTSYKDLLKFPDEAKREAGYQLHRVQNGIDPENWKPFQSVGVGVKEIRISEDSNAYRIMYVAKFEEKIYVLHSFQKKTQKTRAQDINIAKTRFNAIINEEMT